tara:strand:- start:1570 stop:1731 length:162 start_codon:yes stop_codon:yes gene_type:complete
MDGYSFIELVSALWPILAGFVGLIFWLAKSYADIETLKEKVRVLYELYNNQDK